MQARRDSRRTHLARLELRRHVLIALTATFAGCGNGGATPIDAAPRDGAILDAMRAIDAATPDAMLAIDAATPDAPLADAPLADAQLTADAAAPDAAPPCGCTTDQYCDLGGVCQTGPAPTGGFCGPTTTCSFGTANYPDCLNDFCASMDCGYGATNFILFRFVCSRACEIYKDADFDGINDLDAPMDDCGPSQLWDGAAGASYRCVMNSQPQNQLAAWCLPGTAFAACNANVDCPADEVCELSSIYGAASLRCFSRYRTSEAWLGQLARLGGTCNEDAAAGPLVLCSDGLCLAGGTCSAYCASNVDCDTSKVDPGHRCVGNLCQNAASVSCMTDADCSTMECAGSVEFGFETFKYCTPKQ